MTEPRVRLNDVVRRFGRVVAVDGISLDVEPGEFLALLGPSGCGKTTLLRAIAGFVVPNAGQIMIGGRLVSGESTFVPPERRRVGFVFQDYALFPHLSVQDNIAFGIAAAERGPARIAELLSLVGLTGLGERLPHELSGGQQQRVALARALAPGPDVVLLDEPFSNLDASLRVRVRQEVRAILRAAGATAIFVTHDRQEALGLADRIAVLDAGRLLQAGAPEDVYQRPACLRAAQIVGEGDVVGGLRTGGAAETALGLLPIRNDGPDGEVRLLIRPHELNIIPADGANLVRERRFRGADYVYTVGLPSGETVRVIGGANFPVSIGEHVELRPAGQGLLAFTVTETISPTPVRMAPAAPLP